MLQPSSLCETLEEILHWSHLGMELLRRERISLDDLPPEGEIISAAEEYLIKNSNTEKSVLPETSSILNDSGRESDKDTDGSMDGSVTKDNSSEESE